MDKYPGRELPTNPHNFVYVQISPSASVSVYFVHLFDSEWNVGQTPENLGTVTWRCMHRKRIPKEQVPCSFMLIPKNAQLEKRGVNIVPQEYYN